MEATFADLSADLRRKIIDCVVDNPYMLVL